MNVFRVYSVKKRFKYTALVWSDTCLIWVNFATNALFRPINVKKYTDLIKIHQRRFWWCWLIWQMITQQALQNSTKSDPACPTTWKRRWGDKVWKEKIAEHVGTTIPHMVAISVQIVRIGEWMLLVLRWIIGTGSSALSKRIFTSSRIAIFRWRARGASPSPYCVTRAPLLFFVRSWVALSFKVYESVSEWVKGIGNSCPDLHIVQYIKT